MASSNITIISPLYYRGFESLTFRNLGWARHTGATLLLNKGVSMGIISKICGHSSTRITEQIYAKLLEETVVDAITGIEF